MMYVKICVQQNLVNQEIPPGMSELCLLKRWKWRLPHMVETRRTLPSSFFRELCKLWCCLSLVHLIFTVKFTVIFTYLLVSIAITVVFKFVDQCHFVRSRCFGLLTRGSSEVLSPFYDLSRVYTFKKFTH